MTPGLLRSTTASALAMPKSTSFTSPVVGHHHVLRADVAVDELQRPSVHALGVVRVVQPRGHLGADARGHRVGHGRAPNLASSDSSRRRSTPSTYSMAMKMLSSMLPQLEHLHDVGVVQLRGDARLVQEHLDELGLLGEVGEDALDDQQLRTRRRLRQEQLRHPTHREPLDEEVFPEGGGDLWRVLGNGIPRGSVAMWATCELTRNHHLGGGVGKTGSGIADPTLACEAPLCPCPPPITPSSAASRPPCTSPTGAARCWRRRTPWPPSVRPWSATAPRCWRPTST